MRNKLTQSIEDYLKAIYELTQSEGKAVTNQLAEYLEVTPASVSGMIKKLAATEPPLVEYVKHRGVTLTPDGQKVALEILRHHRLLELFLHQMLGYPWDEVHEEADKLEHVISEKFEERIAKVLGNPLHDPHGDPIPSRDLSLPTVPVMVLRDLRPGQRAKVVRVRDTDAELLRYLSRLQIIPGAQLIAREYSDFDGNLYVAVGASNEEIVLGERITAKVYIELCDE